MEKNKHTILIVDDEKNILSAMQRLMKRTDYSCIFSNSGKEALEILSKVDDISVILADMRMPEMDGATFLEKSSKIHPNSVRMVLSGYSERESIMSAINKGHIWCYITKPWDDDDLLLHIKNAIDLFENIKAKNQFMLELKKANAQLDAEVKAKTFELSATNTILHKLLKDEEISEILGYFFETVQLKYNVDCLILFSDIIDVKSIRLGDCEGIIIDETIKKKAMTDMIIISQEKNIYLPLSHQEKNLGLLFFRLQSVLQLDEMHSLEAFSSLLTLVLSQKKLILNAPKLIENIDDLIKGMS